MKCLSSQMLETIRSADGIAAEMNDSVVEPKHMLLAILRNARDLASVLLLRAGVTARAISARFGYHPSGWAATIVPLPIS